VGYLSSSKNSRPEQLQKVVYNNGSGTILTRILENAEKLWENYDAYCI
jgi:hypothetical protein